MGIAVILGHTAILAGYLCLSLVVLNCVLNLYIYRYWLSIGLFNLTVVLLIYWLYYWLTGGEIYLNWILNKLGGL